MPRGSRFAKDKPPSRDTQGRSLPSQRDLEYVELLQQRVEGVEAGRRGGGAGPGGAPAGERSAQAGLAQGPGPLSGDPAREASEVAAQLGQGAEPHSGPRASSQRSREGSSRARDSAATKVAQIPGVCVRGW